jgi:glutathione S-transferase
VNINLASKPEWYLKLTPAGQVPCLQLPDGRVLPESLINSEYLDQAYPGPKLIPSDPYESANHKVIIERYSKLIGSFYKAFRGKDEEALAEFRAALDQLESQIPAKGFLGGF